MVAYGVGDKEMRHAYIPPPQPKTRTNAPNFHAAVAAAQMTDRKVAGQSDSKGIASATDTWGKKRLIDDSVAATQADIDAQLQAMKPKGPNGAYTADQIRRAAKTAIGQGMDPAEIVNSVASGMEATPSENAFLTDLKNEVFAAGKVGERTAEHSNSIGDRGPKDPDVRPDIVKRTDVSFTDYAGALYPDAIGKTYTSGSPGTKRFLLVLAHPDDDTNAYGAIRSALAQGAKIDVVYLTSSEGGSIFENKSGLPEEKLDERGQVDVDPRNGAKRIKEMLDFYEALGAGDNVTVTVLEGNPDFNPFLNSDWWGVRYAQAAQWKIGPTLDVLAGMLRANDYDAILAMTDDPQVHPGHQESHRLSVEAAKIFATTTGREMPAVFGIRETGWYRSDMLRPLEYDRNIRFDFTPGELNDKKKLLTATYKSQPPGYPDFFNYLRDHEILIAAPETAPDQIEALRSFFQHGTTIAGAAPMETLPAAGGMKEYFAVRLPDEPGTQGTRVQGVEVPRQAWKPTADPSKPLQNQRPLSEISGEIASAARTGDVVDNNPGSTPEERWEYHVAQEARRMYLLQAGPKYSGIPTLKSRFGLVRSDNGSFFGGYNRQTVLYVTTSHDFTHVQQGLTLDDDVTITPSPEEAQRIAAAKVGDSGKLWFIYRIAGYARDLDVAQGATIDTKTIEGGVAVINEGGALHPESWLNEAFDPPPAGRAGSGPDATKELHGQPYRMPMTPRERRRAAIKTGATMAGAAAAAFVATKLGGHFGYAATMRWATEVGLGAFGVRAAYGRLWAEGRQTAVDKRVNAIADSVGASNYLRDHPTVWGLIMERGHTVDPERRAALTKEIDEYTTKQQLADDLTTNLEKLGKMLNGVRGALKGISKPDRDTFKLLVEILRTNQASGETVRSLDAAQVLSANSGAAVSKEIIEAGSYGFNHAAGSRVLANVWFDPAGNTWAHFSLNLAGEAGLVAYGSAAIFIPIHLAVNASAVGKRFLDIQAKDDKTYRAPAAGEKLPGYYPGNATRSPATRLVQGLGDPRYVRYSAAAADGVTRLRKAPLVDRLREHGLTGAFIGMVPFGGSSVMSLVQAILSHDWGRVGIESGAVLADLAAMRGFQKLRLDVFRQNRQMGPRVQNGKLRLGRLQTNSGRFQGMVPPPRGALPLPRTPEDWANLDIFPGTWTKIGLTPKVWRELGLDNEKWTELTVDPEKWREWAAPGSPAHQKWEALASAPDFPPGKWAELNKGFADWENFPYDKPVLVDGLPPGLVLFGGMGIRVILGLAKPPV